MAQNNTNPYDLDFHIAEAYDHTQTETADITLIRRLIGTKGPLNILEPFTGTGRILIPLAEDGHMITGIDQAHAMLQRAQQKISTLPEEVRNRIYLIECDLLNDPSEPAWPTRFDLVILGGNCFYELASPDEQEFCVRQAAASLKPGGYVYIDNDHMEGDLAVSWQNTEPEQRGIQGLCADGTYIEGWLQTVWFDAPRRLVQFRRWNKVVYPNGTQMVKEYYQQKHPVSEGEVRGWLEKHGFIIEQEFGDREGNPYTDQSPRAIFWARKK